MGKTLNAENKQKGRESAIELLRIISMLLIILHHFALHSNFEFGNNHLNEFIVQILSMGGKLGVNVFVFISGYFFVTSKFKVKKALKIVFEVFFWSVVCMAFVYGFGFAAPSPLMTFKSFFPLIYEIYWFASAYVFMYLLSPFINVFINKATKKQLKTLLILLFAAWCVIGTIMNSSFEKNDLGWFIFLYLVAAYIRLYPNKQTEKKGTNFTLFGVCIAVEICLLWIYDRYGFQFSFRYEETQKYMCLFKENHVLLFLASVFLFLGFKNMKIGNIKLINVIASATFGVYLIHDNPLVRSVLWEQILKTQNYATSKWIVLYAFAVVAGIYICCTALDLLRQYLLEKPVLKLHDIIEIKVKDKVNYLKKD